jgi:hypothetical protein
MDSVSAKGDVYINTLSLKRALGTLKEQFIEERERKKKLVFSQVFADKFPLK